MKSPATWVALALITATISASAERASGALTLLAADGTNSSGPINNLNSLSLTNGSATLIGSFGVPPVMAGLAYDAVHGILYGTTTATNNLYSIDSSTGAATLMGSLGVPLMHGLAFDNSTGTLFGTYGGLADSGLYRIDVATGQATYIGSVGISDVRISDASRVTGLAFQPGTNILFGSLSGPDQEGGLITIDTATGVGTVVGPMRNITGLAFHPFTGVLYGINNQGTDTLYTIGVNSASVTLVGATGLANGLGLEFAGYRVPEPAGLRLLVIAVGLAIASRSGHRRVS